MFGLTRTPSAQFIGLNQRKLTFVSRASLKVGEQQRIRLSLPESVAKEEVLLKVWVGTSRRIESGGYAYTGEMAQGFALPALEGINAVAQDSALRNAPRYGCHLVLKSPELPSGRALAVDFSEGGIQVTTAAEVRPGDVVRVQLVLEGSLRNWRARVAWCSGNHREGYRAGLQFQDLNREDRLTLEQVAGRLARGEVIRSDPTLPNVTRDEGHTSLGTVVEYRVTATEILIRLETKGEDREYRFPNPRGLMDLYGVVGRKIYALRDTASPGRRRFHFMDETGNVLLEVVAERMEGQRQV